MKVSSQRIVKIVGAAVASALLVAPLAACGGNSAGKVKLTFLSYFNKTQIGKVIDDFEEANPNIQIEMQTSKNYVQTLQTRLAGGEPPTIFNLTMDNRTDVMKSGAALDLTGSDFFDGIDDSNFTLFQKDGKTYGMPVTAWYGGIVYNKDLLKKAGYDEFPKTWDEFLDMGKKLKSMGVTPLLDSNVNTQPSGIFVGLLASYYAGEGSTQMDEDIWNGKTTFSKEWTPVFEQYYRMVEDGILGQETLGIDGDQEKSEFMNGNTALYRSGPWDLDTLRKSGINFGVAAFPAYPSSEQWINGGPDQGFAIAAKASKEKQEAAKKFLAFLNSEQGLKDFTSGAGTQSISSKYTAEVPDEFKEIVTDYLQKGKFYWVNWGKAATTMVSADVAAQQQLIQGKLTPAAAAAKLDDTWNSVK